VSGFTERIDPATGEVYWAVAKRGEALIDDPFLNKGTCFTAPERAALALEGLLPPGVATESEQRARAYENYCRAGDEVQRYLFLAALQDRNETLFYRLLLDHIEEMVPIVYTPTVGKVCEQFSHIYRRPRGVYISTRHRGRIRDVLRQASSADVRIIVVTDNEAILGLGDLGVGGMPIAIGKLALYTAGAGIHPSGCLPIDLDVGTENQALLDDPLYLGIRHRRLRGEAYASLVDEMVDAIRDVYPNALVQWEDFANRNAFFVLDRYRSRVLSFDDDIQGTGAVIVAGIRTALRKVGRRFEDERVVFLGAGASGGGCALAVRAALREAGVPPAELGRRVLCLDSRGLILADRAGLEGEKKEIAADPEVIRGWVLAREGVAGLEDVARNFAPTVLVGASGQPGAFNEVVIRAMHARCARPIVLPISNPTSRAEATPEDVLRWTGGAAVVGTGSPFPPVSTGGVTHQIGQGNNAFIFPGVGLGATSVAARWLPDAAFTAAGRALDEATGSATAPGSPIYPPLRRLRETSVAVARAVARSLVNEGAADPISGEEIDARILGRMWEPRYRPYRPSGAGTPARPGAAHG